MRKTTEVISRDYTDWLKGAVILAVCTNHFLYDYVTLAFGSVMAQMQTYQQKRRLLIILLSIAMLFCINERTNQAIPKFAGKEYIFPVLLAFSALCFCRTFFKGKWRLPLVRQVTFLGSHSYSIYLFHKFGYEQMQILGVFTPHQTGIAGVAVWCLTLPLFIVVYAAVEDIITGVLVSRKPVTMVVMQFLDQFKFPKKTAL
jgi:peptidoglycan/LPS O-acetylase OafA/YrhL